LFSKEDGFKVVAQRLKDLIDNVYENFLKNNKSDKVDYSLEMVVACLSGAGTETASNRLNKTLKDVDFKYKIHIGNDTLAPIFTAFHKGGIVVISGTGSNCVLINPIEESSHIESLSEIKTFNSGGWGNMLGDEGSAYWIAQNAIKFIIDFNDEMIEEDFDEISIFMHKEIDQLKNIVLDHFKVYFNWIFIKFPFFLK
jgi:N-acetylglucosamine kinase-like BadF-type ATPase